MVLINSLHVSYIIYLANTQSKHSSDPTGCRKTQYLDNLLPKDDSS